MTTSSTSDYPVEGGRPSLKWGRKISAGLAGARLTSPDHMISEGPGGTCIKHKPTRATAASLPAATVLYKVLAVREYDENGALVAPGSESSPLATGHALEWVEDWVRAHE